MAIDVFKSAYERIKVVLGADAGFLALVPAGQFKPDFDMGGQPTGNLLTYGWSGANYDQKRRRGVGTLTFTAASPDGKLKAMEIMNKVRTLLTARSISDPAAIVMQLFRELPQTTDQLADAVNRIAVDAKFECKFIAGPNS